MIHYLHIVLFLFITLFVNSCKVVNKKSYNVLLIAVDDLNDWIEPYGGHSQSKTPNLQKLADESMVFLNAQCAASVCNPSRAALMTGIRPSTSGVYQNSQLFRTSEVLKDIQTIPQYFDDYGYTTICRGKIFHHPNGIWADTISWQNYTATEGKGMNNHPDKTQNMLASGMPYNKKSQAGLDWGSLDVKTEESSDYQTTQWIAEQLEKEYDNPFFMACGIFKPHLPWYLPQEYFDKFPLDHIILPDIREDDLKDIPKIGQQMSGGLSSEGDYQRIKKYKKKKQAVQAYLASSNYADERVGEVLEALAKSKYAENTIVILFGDHGWHLGEKLHYRKFVLWEESCRVPFIVKVPGITQRGSKCNRPVNLLDIYPTLVELCNLPQKSDLEGRSIVDLLKNPQMEWLYPSLTTMGYKRHSLRTEQFRYIQYEDGSEELYDQIKDPMGFINLANNPEFNEVKNEFKQWIPKENKDPIPPFQNKKQNKKSI